MHRTRIKWAYYCTFRSPIAPDLGIMGSALFDEMRKQGVDDITVALIYKDAENRWYKTIGKIERNVSETGGLSVEYVRQKRMRRPTAKS